MNGVDSSNSSESHHWNWTYLCPTGLTPYIPDSVDLQPCFQQFCLQFPILVLFALSSLYYIFCVHKSVARDNTQLGAISIRSLAVIVLAIIPVIHIFDFMSHENPIYPVDILLACMKCFTWFLHLVYLIRSRRRGELQHTGPLITICCLVSIFVLDAVWFRTSLKEGDWLESLYILILDVIYFFTCLPRGKSQLVRRGTLEEEERRALLEEQYYHFRAEFPEVLLGHAQDEANIFSRILFYWVNPLISKGVDGHLKKIEDLFDLPDCLNISRISEKLQSAIYQKRSLFWALHKAFGKEFYLIGILRFIADTSGFAGPLFLGKLLQEDTTTNEGTDVKPYYYALGLFMSTVISAFCGTHFNWRMAIVGMKMRAGVVSAIYRKGLEARGLQDARPEILNLMSTDTDRIVNSCASFHLFWSMPFQLFTTLYLLYTQMGSAFIAGVLFAAALIPINRWIAAQIGKLSESLMSAKDARLTKTSETIAGAKQIKLNAWEDIFINKIQKLRRNEVKYLAKRKYLDALCVYFWATTPVMMCLLTFGVSALLGNPLTAATTYTSVALLNMLIGPLNAFPWVLNGLIEAWVSIKRVQELIDLRDLDFSVYYNPIVVPFSTSDTPPPILQIQDGSFEHDPQDDTPSEHNFRLENINLNVKKGELVCIEGPVGAGKSTLISAIVAGVNFIKGSICIQDPHSGFGYVPQTSWLQRGTIRENILWGMAFDEQKYKQVIHACALIQDLQELGGDHVGVGEGGRTLSGGQRVRVSLARAVYQDKKIYLFDDILAALDAHVANHVVKHCILGLLKDKTRIIVTENRTLWFYANQVLNIKNGILNPTDVSARCFEFVDDVMDESDQTPSTSMDFLRDDRDKKSADSVLMEESREYGYLNTDVIYAYWKAIGGWLSFTVLLFVVMMQLTRNISDAWLANWVTDTEAAVGRNFLTHNGTNSNHTIQYYLGIYASLALTNSCMTLIRAFLFAYAGIKAAKFIHDKLLNNVVYTKFQFFDVTSLGRILNRFSSDTYTVDDTLPFILNILLAQMVGLMGAICISVYAMPWLGLIVLPICPIYVSTQYRYRHASRDIKRLSSNALSPLYTHFTETLYGLTIIRAMRASQRFQRDFQVKLEESVKAQLTSSAAQQWLALRLQLLGCLIVGGAGLLAAITSQHATNPALVGLAISYALSITSLLSGFLNAFVETEQELVAVERVNQYLQLDKEHNADGIMNAPFAWPSQGVITFENVAMKYREYLSPAILNLNFKTSSFEKIAIVGRTGAGKSSVLSALLRVAPLAQGTITIDCVNVRALALKVLRDRVVIVPQDPFLFEGTLRENLDPRKRYYDNEIWNAITNCLATPLVQSLGGLTGRIERGGTNLSAGQRQILCLVRALLTRSQIVCIDEGTSNLDSDSETAIHVVLRNAFKHSTVLFVAHRLNELHHMDRIIVMECGKIAEEGTPKDLAADSESLFSKMLRDQRNKDYNQSDGGQ